ncbi:carboxymuconolactone decarboxylase family protein [Veronia pacifica]|uniref:Alkylhydroperoxidase n=1 Tax=Veronia pacifica TaxID=1080227 RepID=A0A1C3ES77_9GAMM|nr:carboxymuconolactone decarboxylase family protein [Veronia pacifica]ODA36090.1 alkylhydroperoxidase [Veronia pacifica]
MHDMANLKKLAKLKEHKPETTKGFWDYDNHALAEGVIPKKYKELMAIAVGLTTQCVYCIEAHKNAAIKAGATEEEFAETIHIAAALRAGGALTHGTHLFD